MEKILKIVKFRQQIQISREGAALGIPYSIPCYEVDFNEYGTVTCDGKIVGRNISRVTVGCMSVPLPEKEL